MTTQRHKYDYTVNPHAAGAKVQRLVGAGKRVLELGSGPGSITRLLKANGCRVTALEVDPSAIELVAPHCDKVLACNLDHPEWPAALQGEAPYESIVAADVLEHLQDPWRTLRQLKPLLADTGHVVVSLPHVAHSAVIASLLDERFEYQPWGLLDRTHLRFFGLRDMQALFNDVGFKIIEADFVVKSPEQTEFAGHWRRLPEGTRQALAANPYSTVYQVVVKATLRESPGKAIQLLSLPVAPPSPGAYSTGAHGNRLLGFALSLLSLRNRETLARLLARIGWR